MNDASAQVRGTLETAYALRLEISALVAGRDPRTEADTDALVRLQAAGDRISRFYRRALDGTISTEDAAEVADAWEEMTRQADAIRQAGAQTLNNRSAT